MVNDMHNQKTIAFYRLCSCDVPKYIEISNRLKTNHDSYVTSDRTNKLMNHIGIELRLSGVKAHSCLKIGERKNETLRRNQQKLRTVIMTLLQVTF